MDTTGFLVLVFASVFFIVDPFANIPVFISFLERYSAEERKKIIQKSSVIAFVAYFFFSFFGTRIFDYLGIQIFSFKIAGGILLSLISLEMLFGFKTRTELTEKEIESVELQDSLAVTPLAIPLITGPGAITTGIVLASKATGAEQLSAFVIGSTAAFVLSYLLLMQSKKISEIFGLTGMKVITRIMGLLLLAIAIQFVLTGLNEANVFFV
ncbi:MAG: MarC family protein [archaeon]